MIKIENIKVSGWEAAIRGMRNPMNSWDRIDSYYDSNGNFVIGENDLGLMRKLYNAGSEHRKYLRMINVSMDIVAPLYWISEFDTYKVGTVRNSCSFMHKGVSKHFEITDFSVHSKLIYEILNPLELKKYELYYPYETDQYKIYKIGEREYEVYRNGRIIRREFSVIDQNGKLKGRKKHFPRREIKPSITKYGYFEIRIGGRNDGEHWLLHRLIATVWIDNPEKYNTVDHINCNKGDNSVENLQWCSLEDNIKKGFEDGAFDRGKSLHTSYIKWKNGHRLIDPFEKENIWFDIKLNKMSRKELSDKYSYINQKYLDQIAYGKEKYNFLFTSCYHWEQIIECLNDLRELYLETKDNDIFADIRRLLPCGYNQKYTVSMNYEVLINILKQRKGHKLEEWHDFCDIMLRECSYLKEIMGVEE